MEKSKISLRAYSLIVYIILLPVANLRIGSLGSLLKWIALVPIAINGLGILKGKKIKINSGNRWVLIYTIYLLITVLYSINIKNSLARVETYLLFSILIIFINSMYYTRYEIYVIRVSMVISSIITGMFAFMFGELIDGYRLTLGGIFTEDPNYLVGYFIFGIIFCMSYFFEEKKVKKFKKVICISIIGFFLGVVLLTGSRGGLLGVISSLGIYYFLTIIKDKNKLLKIIKLMFVSFIMLIAIIILMKYLPSEITERFEIKSIVEGNGTGRFDLWKICIEMFKDSPIYRQIFGYGTATISYITVNGAYIARSAHSFWIENLLEIGVVGVVIAAIMYYKFLYIAYKKRDFVSVASLIGIIFMSLSLSLQAFKPLWNILIIIGLFEYRNDN